MQTERNFFEQYQEVLESRISAGATEEITWVGKTSRQRRLCRRAVWKDMLKKCVERYRELANKKTEQLQKLSSPCVDDHQFKKRRSLNQWENYPMYAHKLSLKKFIPGTNW